MTTALSRAVFDVSFSRVRTALLAAASTSLLIGLSAPANAACVGDGTPNTCTLVLAAPGANQEAIGGAGTVDAGAVTDTLVFNLGGVGSLNANTIGTGDLFTAPLRFLDFEAAQVSAGTTLDLTGTGTSTTSLTWTIDGVLNTFGGNAIGDASAVTVNAGGLLELGIGSETIGSLAGAGLVNILSPAVLNTGGNNSSTVFTGIIQGSGGLSKVGTGTMELNSNNSFTGLLTVAGGILEIGHADAIDDASGVTITGGTLSGETAYAIVGPVTITTTSALSRLTGNATITGNVSSNGGLQPGNTAPDPVTLIDNPGQEMGTITIDGNYTTTGTNAYVGMFVNLDAAFAAPVNGTTHDFLHITGAVGGTNRTLLSHLSFLNNPVGGATTGNGIQLVRVDGTNSGNDFYQGTAIAAGPYQYLLKYVSNYSGASDGYFLQSAVRDEIVAQAAILSAGQSMVRNCHRDDQRIPDSPKGATYGRAWVGYRQGSTDFGTDTGIDASADFSCTTGGMDWRMGHGWFGGVSGGFGSVTGDVQTPAGNGTMEGNSRAIEAFASFTSSTLFVNLSGGYVDMDWIFNGALIPALAAKTSGFLGAAQAGVALDLDPLAVKLIGGLSYDGTECSDACMGLATTQDTGLIEAKGTIRFDGVGMGGAIRPWAAVSLSDVISDGINTVSMGGVSVSADTNAQLLSIDAGLQGYLDQNFALFIDAGYHQGLSVSVTGYKAGVGLKMYW